MGKRSLSVVDVMTVDATVIAVDASLEEADRALRSTVNTGLPVVDGSGALVGVVTHADLAVYRFAERKPAIARTRNARRPS